MRLGKGWVGRPLSCVESLEFDGHHHASCQDGAFGNTDALSRSEVRTSSAFASFFRLVLLRPVPFIYSR